MKKTMLDSTLRTLILPPRASGFFIAGIIFAAFLFVYAQSGKDEFELAKDVPRGALIYAQTTDLPQFIKLWSESKFKEDYLKSANFDEFSNGHLGRKLASRWKEFNAAAGFDIDLETVAKLAENRAAIALYDVGKLEFVFVAPVSGEIFAATKFLQGSEKFNAETLADGTEIYRTGVEADRGRQKQELIFTYVKGRLIVATSVKLLGQTIDNINGKASKNHLSDEADFQILSAKTSPHAATVWLDQKALNEDYYFKRYWLMSKVEDLKNIRAAIFDFEIGENKIVEKRRFALEKSLEKSPFSARQTEEMLSFLPAGLPFYSLQKADEKILGKAIQKTCIYRKAINESRISAGKVFREYDYDDYEDFSSLNASFDEKIDESDDVETIERAETQFDFLKIMQSANPQSVLTFAQPRVLPAPLFVEFDRAAVFDFASPRGFNAEKFEAEVGRVLLADTTITAPNFSFSWETKSSGEIIWRELKLPLIEHKVCYAARGRAFILTNNSEFLQKILAGEKTSPQNYEERSFSSLTVIDLTQKENAFNRIFDEFKGKSGVGNFLTRNVESLLNTASSVKKIEIKRNAAQKIFEEEIIFYTK